MRPWHFTEFASKIGCTLPGHSAAASAARAQRALARAKKRKVKAALRYMCAERTLCVCHAFGQSKSPVAPTEDSSGSRFEMRAVPGLPITFATAGHRLCPAVIVALLGCDNNT